MTIELIISLASIIAGISIGMLMFKLKYEIKTENHINLTLEERQHIEETIIKMQHRRCKKLNELEQQILKKLTK